MNGETDSDVLDRCQSRLKKIRENKDTGHYARAYEEDVSALIRIASSYLRAVEETDD